MSLFRWYHTEPTPEGNLMVFHRRRYLDPMWWWAGWSVKRDVKKGRLSGPEWGD